MEDKAAYPYITEFKKEPYKSYVLIQNRKIRSFYLKEYDKIKELYHNFQKIPIQGSDLNLEYLYWFLLGRKFLKEPQDDQKDEFYYFIQKCEVEVLEKDQIGFKMSPSSEKLPDIWSTYYAISCLNLLGFLNERLISEKREPDFLRKIKNFVFEHKKQDKFFHCLEKDCLIRKKPFSSMTLYFVLEIFIMLGIDVRVYKEQFRNYLSDRHKNPSIVFKLLSMKYLDLESDIKDKEIQFLHQNQKGNGGFSFKNDGSDINETFWIVNALESYSWLIDYNPVGIYSFINLQLNQILDPNNLINIKQISDLSKLIILLCLIWKKFIEHIERVLFRQLERHKYIDMHQIEKTFGLYHGIDEIVLYINLSYSFNLKIIDNKKEFKSFLSELDKKQALFLQEFYTQLGEKSIVSLSEILKKQKSKFPNSLKIREEIFPLINRMIERNFFKGNVRSKRGFSLKTKHYFFLEFLMEKIIVTDTEINTERIFEEKVRLEEIKNDIFNMTLNLKNATKQIKDEIESYLLIDEINYAKERLRYLLRNSLMEADFLNENIENSFNEDLLYINIQATLKNEILAWNKLYSALQKRLIEIEKCLLEKIQEKEELRNFTLLLDKLEDKIFELHDHINMDINQFRISIPELFEEGYDDEKFNLVTVHLSKLSQNVNKYDQIIYKTSQQITSKDKKIVKRHKEVIDKWIKIKTEFDSQFSYYTNGFQFFNETRVIIEEVIKEIQVGIQYIKDDAANLVKDNQFKEAFEIIKQQSDLLLAQKRTEIKSIGANLKNEIKNKQKLFALYKHLQESLEKTDENIIDLIAKQGQSIKKKVVEERNRVKIEDLENFIIKQIQDYKSKLEEYKVALDQMKNKKISYVIDGFDNILSDFDNTDKKFNKKHDTLLSIVDDFDEKSIAIIQWNQFKEFLSKEIAKLKEEYINGIISEEVNLLTKVTNSDKIDIKRLADNLKLKCKTVIPRIKDLIEISKLQGELFEDKKELVVHTKDYYKNKELTNFVENKLLKQIQEIIGKFLALYDSCMKNKTLGVNILEIQNRIDDLRDFNVKFINEYEIKVNELTLNEERLENIDTKKRLIDIIEVYKQSISSIENNLKFFIDMQQFIDREYDSLKFNLDKHFSNFFEESEKKESYVKALEFLKNKIVKFEEYDKNIHVKIERKLQETLNKSSEIHKFETEIREYNVKKKNDFRTLYDKKILKIQEGIEMIKFEAYRTELSESINKTKIHLSQLLGMLLTRVGDYIETEQFKKAYSRIKLREKDIESEIKESQKKIKYLVREYDKLSHNFETKNRHLIKDFDLFINEFHDILIEKVKSSEEQILKVYVQMAIKAVAHRILTVNFLQNELKIKKQVIQKHLISIISAEQLSGKYDPLLGIYYEDPEALKELDEKELEVMTKMNFRIHRIIKRLKVFGSQYGSIFAIFSPLLAVIYYLFMLTGQNPVTIIISGFFIAVLLIYIMLKKKKEDKLE
ncbi:MAG: prenyltransferase/squalene oxidase repeat-containing protein [Promethearchaeota archaeon]